MTPNPPTRKSAVTPLLSKTKKSADFVHCFFSLGPAHVFIFLIFTILFYFSPPLRGRGCLGPRAPSPLDTSLFPHQRRSNPPHSLPIWNWGGQMPIFPTLRNRICVHWLLQIIVPVMWKWLGNRRKATANIHKVQSNMNNSRAARARIYPVNWLISSNPAFEGIY